MAFGTSYLVLFNIRNASSRADSLRADAAAEAGAERIRWEVRNNGFNLAANCNSNLFTSTFSDGSYYVVNCSLTGSPTEVSVTGYYKSSHRILSVSCLNLNEECKTSCGVGSYCGGGILVSTSTRLVVAPSACTATSSAGCSNNFSVLDATLLAWNTLNGSSTGSTDVADGRVNVAKLGTTTPDLKYRAAKFCDDLTVNSFSNWYLPALNELNLLLANSNRCTENISGSPVGCQNGSSTNPIIPGFTANTYWTSNDTASGGGGVSFSSGTYSSNLVKSTSYYFRCIRRF